MDLKEMREKRGNLISEARALIDKAKDEKRDDLTQEEQNRYDQLMTEAGSLASNIDRVEKLEAEERRLAASQTDPDRPDPNDDKDDKPERRDQHPRATDEYRAAFNRWLRGGPAVLATEELRALQADDDEAGGYLVAPQQMASDLIKAVDDQVFIRQLAHKETVATAQSLGVASLDADPADADWTSELATGSEDSTMDFGKRELNPHPLAKRIKVSNKLLRMRSDAEALVRERLAYKFGVTEEKAFLTGSGSGQPLGVFTASAQGISTARDVSTGNTTTEIGADNLIEVKYTLKGAYWPRARWLFHRDAVKQIAKLKDGDGQYIWQPGLQAGQPDRLLSFPVNVSEFAPNTFTTGLYVGILGDFMNYWIADALDMQFQRLVELYAETNQVGFIGRLETDGMPVLEEAFVRSKLA